jgi:dephospho-CoA kinase
MPVLGVTGGIATGKSSFVRALQSHLSFQLFDADLCAHELLAGDMGVQIAIRDLFGPIVFQSAGIVDRERLRELVFSNAENRRGLEEILHPVIRSRWLSQAETYRQSPEWFCADIPLLYETGAEGHFDRVVVVASTEETQRRRLREVRRLDEAMIEKMIGVQEALGLKIKKADHVIWNDSTVSCLDGQTRLFAGWLRKHYG